MKKLLVFCFVIAACTASGQEDIAVMFYNLYRFPARPPANREHILKNIMNTYGPDLFMVSELVNEDGADRILHSALNVDGVSKYGRATFVFTQGDAGDPLHQMVFYNQQKLILVRQEAYPTKVRDINHYTFLLKTVSDSIYLDAFVAHLKSSEGAANRQLRLEMADTFVKKLATVPQGHYVLFAGDFNFYSSFTEPAYGRIIDTGNAIIMVDPIQAPGNWNNNDSFRAIHTQATRLSTDGFGQGGASGGMDDRFDFIMMSGNLKEGGALQYVNGSYKAYGNNGNCFDNRIDAYDCDGAYSLALRQDLYNMSDHLPVVMQLKVNQPFAVGINDVPAYHGAVLLHGNRVNDYLMLRWDGSTLPAICAVYNTLGRPMPVAVTKTNGHLQLDFRQLKAGLYYLRLGEKQPAIYKIVKI